MRRKEMLLLGALLAFSTVLAKELWEAKSYHEWTQREALALLTDSPWAVSRPVQSPGSGLLPIRSPRRGGSESCSDPASQAGVGGVPARTGTSSMEFSEEPRIFTVRFVSAQPIRMAIARWAILNRRLTPEQAELMLSQDTYGGNIVVSVAASNDRDWSELNNFATEELNEKAYLMLKKSKRKIPAHRYVPPVESGLGEGLFYFVRAEGGMALVTPDEQEVSFHCSVSSRTRLRRIFRLKYMMFDGKLAI